jgi:hypothetical protein
MNGGRQTSGNDAALWSGIYDNDEGGKEEGNCMHITVLRGKTVIIEKQRLESENVLDKC